MALNHMGHVVLTSHLLPLMKETAEKGKIVRIVNQASNAHHQAPSDTKFESPGFVSTKMSKQDIFEAFPLGGYAMAVGMEPFKKTQFEGAVPAMFAATVTQESGQYICPPAVPEPGSKLAQDDALADRLMELTRKIIVEKTKPESAGQGCPFDDLGLH